MLGNILKRSFVIGIIILFLGAVILPAANSICTQKPGVPVPAPYIQETFCEYNLTFYGSAYMTHPLKIGNKIAIVYLAFSTEKTKKPVANLYYKNIVGYEESQDIENAVTFFAIMSSNFETNMNFGATTIDGYISGKGVYISYSYY